MTVKCLLFFNFPLYICKRELIRFYEPKKSD